MANAECIVNKNRDSGMRIFYKGQWQCLWIGGGGIIVVTEGVYGDLCCLFFV